MDNDVRPTWRLAWGVWWRWLLINLGIAVIVGGIVFILMLLGVICVPSCFGWLPGI